MYRDQPSGSPHIALVRGTPTPDHETPVRVHEPLSVLDLLEIGSSTHSWTLDAAMKEIAARDLGVIVLLNCRDSKEHLIDVFQAFDRKDKADAAEAPPDRFQDLRHRRADPARTRRRQDAGAVESAQARQHVGLWAGSDRLHSDAGLPGDAGGRCRRSFALGLSARPRRGPLHHTLKKRTQSMEIGQYQPNLDGDGLRIGIVQSRFNEPVCNGLADACIEELERLGVIGQDVLLVTVPGALEIPLALQKLAESGPIRRADRARRRGARRDVSLRTGVERKRRGHLAHRARLRHAGRERGADDRKRRASRRAHDRKGPRRSARGGRNGEPVGRARAARRRRQTKTKTRTAHEERSTTLARTRDARALPVAAVGRAGR